jgi:hypothetical protein
VELEVVESISAETVRVRLKKTLTLTFSMCL